MQRGSYKVWNLNLVTVASQAHVTSCIITRVLCETSLHNPGLRLDKHVRVFTARRTESHCCRPSTHHNYRYNDSQFKIRFTTRFSSTTEYPATVQPALITCD